MTDEGDFFWLLSQQRDAAAVAKARRKEQLVGGAAAEPGTPAPPATTASAERHDTQVASSPAAALLRALSKKAEDVCACVQQQGFEGLAPGSEALRAACAEALLAALLQKPASSDGSQPALAAACDTAAAAATAVAACGLASVVQQLLQLGADPSTVREEDGMTSLVAALSGGHVEAAGQLLDAGAAPDPPAWAAATAEATAAGAADGGATGNRTPKRKRKNAAPASGAAASASGGAGAGLPAPSGVLVHPTPLVLAVIAGSQGLVQRLLDAGADVSRQCTVQLAAGQAPVSLTPLVAAVQTGSGALVDCLLRAGADVHQKCFPPGSGGTDWTSALSAAVLGGSQEIVHQLVTAGACAPKNAHKAPPGAGGSSGTSAGGATGSQAAPGAGSGQAGGQAGAAGHIGQDHPALRAVVLAAQRGRLGAVELLYPLLAGRLQGGSAAMLSALRRRTILHPLAAAAEKGHLAVLDCLLRLGAPPDHDRSVVAGVAQHTPLMLAAANGHLTVMERLLAAGASPLKVNVRDLMPAALALQRGQLAAVQLLLEHGREICRSSSAGQAGVEDGHASGSTAQGSAAGAAGAFELAPGSPGLQLGNASRVWQLGWAGGQLPRSKPTSLAALERERQRYRLLLLALLGAYCTGGADGNRDAAGNGLASNRQAGGSVHSTASVPAANGAAALGAVNRVRALATPASLAHAAAGSEALLDALLRCGLSVRSVDPTDGSFPLMAAAHHGWDPMLRLLSRGADPNQADSSGTTVLMLMAARPAMLDTAKQLLGWHDDAQQAQQAEPTGTGAASCAERGEPAQGGPADQRAPLAPQHVEEQQASAQRQQQQQQQPSVQQQQQQQPLLDLAQRDSEGRDAVGVAIAARNRRFAEELLSAWVVCSAPPDRRAEAAAAAPGVANKAYDVLVERGAKRVGDINAPLGGQHLLLAQVQTANRKQLRQLFLLPGVDLNVKDPASGRTPLMLLALRQQQLAAADLLATGRAELEARDASGATAALLAARAGDGLTLRALLDAGADPDCADNGGDTLLMALARLGQHKLLFELLSTRRAACVNCQDTRGWTALHHAAAAGHFGACRVLRTHDADVGLCTAEGGKTALELAREGGHAACLPLLRAGPSEGDGQ